MSIGSEDDPCLVSGSPGTCGRWVVRAILCIRRLFETFIGFLLMQEENAATGLGNGQSRCASTRADPPLPADGTVAAKKKFDHRCAAKFHRPQIPLAVAMNFDVERRPRGRVAAGTVRTRQGSKSVRRNGGPSLHIQEKP
jgi:hypothetical protein